jgi:hypothetical protein
MIFRQFLSPQTGCASYAIGALLSGAVADALSIGAAIHLVAAITLASGVVTLAVMRSPQVVEQRQVARA